MTAFRTATAAAVLHPIASGTTSMATTAVAAGAVNWSGHLGTLPAFNGLPCMIIGKGVLEMKKLCWTAAALPVLLAGCNAPDASTPPAKGDASTAEATVASNADEAMAAERAVADLKTAAGAAAGKATAATVDGRVMLTLQVEGLPPGQHGVHVHMTGKCDAPKFESAGGHWNPADAHHGLEAAKGQHAGDMPNLVVEENGRGKLAYELHGATLAGLMDGDGSAMVVHASADDQKTDPSGNSGDRIACGVFKAGQAAQE
ncbi:superoxide dismutase family protein [Sphingopyxis panaciterrae]